MDDVGDVAEVTACFSIAKDGDGLSLDHGVDPLGDDGRIGTIGILARAEDVEITEPAAGKLIKERELLGVAFVDGLGEGVGGEKGACLVFDLGERGVVAIDRAAGGVDEAIDLGVATSEKDVEEAVDIGLMSGLWVINGERDGSEGSLMKNVIDAFSGSMARGSVREITFNEFEVLPRVWPNSLFNLIQIVLIPRYEVV